MEGSNMNLTDIRGVKVGHYTDSDCVTGLTAILFPDGAVASGEVRGAAPGTREMSLLSPERTVQRIDAVLLTGGSAFGLDSASGVMRYLSQQGRGVEAAGELVPIVPAAVIFDLNIGCSVYPDGNDAYHACKNASEEPVQQGSVGAGTGATVGKAAGVERSSKGGLGSSCVDLAGGGRVGAVCCINALGNVVDEQGTTLAGVRKSEGGYHSAEDIILAGGFSASHHPSNTTLSVVVTDVCLDKVACLRVAQMAHDGMARSIYPCHTAYDGDAVFVVSLQRKNGSAMQVGIAAARVVAESIRRGVQEAESLGGIPSGLGAVR